MISVVLGTFNRLNKLKKSIESIAKENPSVGNIEVLVADGGSTDGTLEYLRSKPYGLDLKYIGEGALHGVTRCYNRLFRIANRPLVTWTSDDCRYESGSIKALVDRIYSESDKTLVGCYTDNNDGRGWVEFSDQKCCTIGGARKTLYQAVDFWSEDYVTYASDVEFSYKINRMGGQVVFEKNAKVFHEMDSNDILHGINNGENVSSKRFSDIFTDRNLRRFENTKNIYSDVFIVANSIEETIKLIEVARINISWGNFYVKEDFGYKDLLASMNVFVDTFEENKYDIVLDKFGSRLGSDRYKDV